MGGMRLPAYFLALAVSAALAGPVAAPATSTPAAPGARPARADTGYVLQRTDPGYDEAMAFADFLQTTGIRIALIGRSKLAGFLDRPAASFVTDHGGFAVVFFPEPDGAEHVVWDVKKEGALYRHTFRWNDGAREHTAHMTTDAPQRYLKSGPWFITTWSDSTYDVLKDALTLPRQGVG